MLKQFVTRFFTLTFLLLFTLVLAACPANRLTTESTTTESATVNDAIVTAAPTEETSRDVAAQNENPAASTSSDAVTFTIVPDGTEARFSIYELLMGQDKTVVGTTAAVEGSITVDPANPASATIAPIRIDASTLATDSGRRDGAIQRWILESNKEQYKYIVFTPTQLDGLPATVAIGEPFTFAVIGDLTIRDVTKQETFTVTVTATSETELVGLGQTTVMRGDYNLTIPSVPSVANVAEEVPLEIEFRATAS